MDDLVKWLRVQLDEDEEAVRCLLVEPVSTVAAGPVNTATGAPSFTRIATPKAGTWRATASGPVRFVARVDTATRIRVAVEGMPGEVTAEQIAEHIARHDPARVLAEVDAKRRRIHVITELATRDPGTALLLAKLETLPHADRPGYREEWKP